MRMMHSRVAPSRFGVLHQSDRIVLVLLSTVIFAIALMLTRELQAGTLNRIELNAVIGAAIALGLIQVWLSLRTVLALTLWAASEPGEPMGATPWCLPIWWLGTVPTGWLGLALPGHERDPLMLALQLVMIAWSARALTDGVQILEARTRATAR
jgi:hypothetical protein